MREELVNGRGNDSQPLLDGPPSDAPPTYSSIDVPAAADRGAGNPPGQYYYAAPPAGAPPPNDAPPTYNSAEVQGLQGSGNFDPTLGQGQHQSFDYSKAAPVDYGAPPAAAAAPGASENPYGYGSQQQISSQSMYPPPPSQGSEYQASGAQPYNGLAPPSYDNQPPPPQQYPPPQQQYANNPQQQYPGFVGQPPAQQVNVQVHHHHVDVSQFKPLSYGSSFTAHIRTHRHHNKYVSLNSHLEVVWSAEPTAWNFILTDTRDAYLVVAQWAPSPGKLQLRCAPTPIFLRANPRRKWQVETSFGMVANNESVFQLENNGGHFAIRNRASGKFMCAESHCLRADRPNFKDWEKFSISVLSTDQNLTVLTPFGPMQVQQGVPCVDLVLTYHTAFRAKVCSKRNHDASLGLKKGRLTFTNEDSVWEFIPHPNRNAYFIRNADHPDTFWNVGKDHNLKPTHHRHEVESAFQVEFHHNRYFFRCLSNPGKYGSADSSHVVFNRDQPKDWEAFLIVVVHQLDA